MVNKSFITGLGILLCSISAQAMSVDWVGNYRFEYTDIDKPSLGNPGLRKSYFLNHINLGPRIQAMDGVTIVANIELLPNATYPDSQLGSVLGTGARANASTSALTSTNQSTTSIVVNQAYVRAQQEYGALLAGRAPLEFGLGITHNAGGGLFDHWAMNRDLVGYKIMIGNFFVMPIVGKVYDSGFEYGGDATDVIWNLQYENPETESAIGVFYQQRTSNDSSNDAQQSYGGTARYGYSVASSNLYISRGFEVVKIKFEAGFNSGGSGVLSSTGEDVKVSGYGMVLDLDFPSRSKWHWNLRSGLVSGDNPNTATYEGYTLNRNYDLAFLMFNHPLGTHNPLMTSAYRYRSTCGTPPCPVFAVNQSADEEMVSNAMFLAPTVDYAWSDRWSVINSLVWAQTQVKSATDADRNLGLEWDLSVTYTAHKNVKWLNQFGAMFPGAAWKGGPTVNAEAGTTLGFRSAVAVSF